MKKNMILGCILIVAILVLTNCSQNDRDVRVSENSISVEDITTRNEPANNSEQIDEEVIDIEQEVVLYQLDDKDINVEKSEPEEKNKDEIIIVSEEKIETDSVDKLTLFEENMKKAATLEDIFDLYEPHLDGAYGYGYMTTLVHFFKSNSSYEFISTLSQLENYEKALEIARELSSGIYGLDENTHYTGKFSTEIATLLSEDKLSQEQVVIAETLLSHAPGLVKNTPYSKTNIFGSLMPLAWVCPEGDLNNYGGGYSWYRTAIIPEVNASSSLASYDGRYDPKSAYDFNLKTAWSEGVGGLGIGETFTIVLQGYQSSLYATSIDIVNGYIKTDTTWVENGRVKKLRVDVNGEFLGNLLLFDSKLLQRFDIGKISLDAPNDLIMTFTILEVYPGAKYEDTLITELTIDGIGDQ